MKQHCWWGWWYTYWIPSGGLNMIHTTLHVHALTHLKGCGGVRNDHKTHVGVKKDPRTCLTWLYFGPVIKVKLILSSHAHKRYPTFFDPPPPQKASKILWHPPPRFWSYPPIVNFTSLNQWKREFLPNDKFHKLWPKAIPPWVSRNSCTRWVPGRATSACSDCSGYCLKG